MRSPASHKRSSPALHVTLRVCSPFPHTLEHSLQSAVAIQIARVVALVAVVVCGVVLLVSVAVIDVTLVLVKVVEVVVSGNINFMQLPAPAPKFEKHNMAESCSRLATDMYSEGSLCTSLGGLASRVTVPSSPTTLHKALPLNSASLLFASSSAE